MNLRHCTGCAAVLAALTFAPAAIANNSENRPAQVLELFRLSGLEAQLESMEDQIITSIASSGAPMTDARMDTMAAAVRKTFATRQVKQDALDLIQQNWNPAAAAEMLTWLQSLAGQQITRLEEAAAKGAHATYGL